MGKDCISIKSFTNSVITKLCVTTAIGLLELKTEDGDDDGLKYVRKYVKNLPNSPCPLPTNLFLFSASPKLPPACGGEERVLNVVSALLFIPG